MLVTFSLPREKAGAAAGDHNSIKERHSQVERTASSSAKNYLYKRGGFSYYGDGIDPVILQENRILSMKRRSILIVTVLFAAHAAQAEPSPTPVHNRATVNHAFRAGERLSYNVSWSGLLTAGTAAMEVIADRTPEGKEVFHLVSTARSAGIVTAFYPVADSIRSGLLTAGTAAMEVIADRTPEGKEVFHLVSTARSAGIVTAFYPVADSI